jgi:hypothetical protein
LPHSKLGSTSDDAVVDALSARLLSDDILNGRTTALLLVNLIDGRFLRTVHAKELHLEVVGEDQVAIKNQTR